MVYGSACVIFVIQSIVEIFKLLLLPVAKPSGLQVVIFIINHLVLESQLASVQPYDHGIYGYGGRKVHYHQSSCWLFYFLKTQISDKLPRIWYLTNVLVICEVNVVFLFSKLPSF